MKQRQMEPREGYVAVGRVQRPWGLHGDLKVESLTDFPERFVAGARVWIDGAEWVIERSRAQKGDIYLKLAGIDSPAAGDPLRNALIEVPESELIDLPEGDYYHFQLEGLPVVTTGGETVGTVAEVMQPGGNAVLVVRGDRGEVLVPFIEDVIRAVDLEGRRIEVDLFEGLLPDEPRPARPRRPSPYQRRKQRRPAADTPASPRPE